MVRSIYSVDPKYLGMLAADAAVALFRKLLWAEARRAGIGLALVSTPSAITVADGGIDAEVANVPLNVAGGVLFPGLTRYQIKTGAFSAANESEMKALFLDRKGDLKERIRTCFEQDGTFVGVLFGSDVPDTTDNALEEACVAFVATHDSRYPHPKIKIFRQNQLAGFFEVYPALASEAQLKSFANLKTHNDWARLIDRDALEVGPPQESLISGLCSELRGDVARHFCIWGEPGIGKTRLLYEALASDDLSSSLAYFKSPASLDQSGLKDELVRDEFRSAIVVVDDCTSRDREGIWRELKGLGGRVRLITVQHDPCESSGTTVAFPVPLLADEHVSAIIQQHNVDKQTAERFVPYCGGSPRVATVIGWNLEHNPDDLTRPLDTENVWERFIEGSDARSSEMVSQRKLVLTHIALFKRFGYGEPFVGEAKAIAALVARIDSRLTWGKFQEIVHSLQQRKILQGETTLYITPRLLHIKLWCDWWSVYGGNFVAELFLADIPDSLHDWFYEMFAYAHGSEAAKKAVTAILSQQGAFLKHHQIKTEAGANFFLNLSEANTGAALAFLEAALGEESPESLKAFETGRQRIVWALEKIAVEKAFFSRAARLLLRLAENENRPSISNNATGTFASLFSLGPGRTAPTQAPPAERFPVLEAALTSGNPDTLRVALKACDRALESRHFSRMAGAERRGLVELELWSPRTYDEWHDAYEHAWKLLRDKLPDFPEDERAEAGRILLKHAFGLLQVERLQSLVTETINSIASSQIVPRKEVLRTALFIIENSQNLQESIKERWKAIELDTVGGTDFSARLKRKLVLPAWHEAHASGMTTEPWRALAMDALDNRDILLKELPWLMSSEAESAGAFGYELGQADDSFSLEEPLINAIETIGSEANSGLLGGYLCAMQRRDAARFHSAIRRLSENPKTRGLFPSLVMQSGLTDEAANILAGLISNRKMPAYYLQGFIFGGEIRKLSLGKFLEWMDLLRQEPGLQAAIAALRLLHYYCRRENEDVAVSREQYESVLLREDLFTSADPATRGEHHDYDWAEATRALLRTYPESKMQVAHCVLKHMGTDSVVVPQFGHSYAHQVLDEIARESPSQTWAIAASYIGPPIDSRARSITLWLRGGDLTFGSGTPARSLLGLVPLADIWHWVDQEVERRAWYLASFVPNELSREKDQPCLSREVLIRYGDRDDVQRNLMANFSTEGWMGPESEHLLGKKEQLELLLRQESEPRVIEWLRRYIEHLEASLSRSRMWEEREQF